MWSAQALTRRRRPTRRPTATTLPGNSSQPPLAYADDDPVLNSDPTGGCGEVPDGRLAPAAFAAMAEQVLVEGVAVRGLDLTGAVLRNVTSKGVDLAAVMLPDDPGLRIIRNYPRVMRKAAAALLDSVIADAERECTG